MRKNRIALLSTLVLVLGFVLSHPGNVLSQEVRPSLESVVQEGNYQGIPFLSGGVGLGEREELQQRVEAGDFNLKLIFAITEGNYLGNVNVVIENAQGGRVLETVSSGPWFYTKLPAGSYLVTATTEDGASQQKRVNVSESGQSEQSFYWREGLSHGTTPTAQ